jgi:hypothetical protein
MRNVSATLQPAAFAVAGGVAAIALMLFGSLGMLGAGSMMGGWMMGGYGQGPTGYHMGFGSGLFMLVWAFVGGALAGWVLATVYNRVASGQRDNSDAVSGGPLTNR